MVCAAFLFTGNKAVLTLEEQLSDETQAKTQFGKITDKLGIDIFPAHSPQAKGRIERLWNTLHDRLLTEFKVAGIRTVDRANEFLKQYIFDFGQRFAVPPEEKESYFVPYHDERNLDILLSATYRRKTDSCGCFSFCGFLFRVDAPKGIFNKTVQFFFNQRIGLKAQIDNKTYDVRLLSAQPLKNPVFLMSLPGCSKRFLLMPLNTSFCIYDHYCPR